LIARDAAYTVLSSFAVAPLTTRLRSIATTVLLDPTVDPVPEQCIVSLDHIQVINAVGWSTRWGSFRLNAWLKWISRFI